MRKKHTLIRVLLFACVIIALVVGYGYLAKTDLIALIEDGPGIKIWIQHLGVTGPLTVIGLMALAIVLSPIPSAPIALAAGAAYGHIVGTIYVATGSEIGAIIAFFIARLSGFDVTQHGFGGRLINYTMSSQNALMGIVFASRLMPFISFDMVSYAAGMTPLHFWRFALATLAGIIPASFLLAHFGSEIVSGETQRIGLTLFILGAVSLVVLIIQRDRLRK